MINTCELIENLIFSLMRAPGIIFNSMNEDFMKLEIVVPLSSSFLLEYYLLYLKNKPFNGIPKMFYIYNSISHKLIKHLCT